MATAMLRASLPVAGRARADGTSTSARCLAPRSCLRAPHHARFLNHTQTCARPSVGALRAAPTDIFEEPGMPYHPMIVLSKITVRDVMTVGVHAVKPDTTVDEALHLLVNYKVTGLPVCNDEGVVVGVVSDFDLLALDSLGRSNDEELFPLAGQTWQAFKEVKSLLARTMGKKIQDVMTKNPVVVTPQTCLEDATRLLLCNKIRRLPVVDEEGRLVGILSRGNIVVAALAQRVQEAPRCDLPFLE